MFMQHVLVVLQKKHLVTARPVTSLGHLVGRIVF